jgi:ComEC/Rec2-related protein
MSKIGLKTIVLISFVVLLFTQKSRLYYFGVVFANGLETYLIGFQLEREVYISNFRTFSDNRDETTSLIQTISDRGAIGRDRLYIDSAFAKIKGLKLGLKSIKSAVGNSVITWIKGLNVLLNDSKMALAETVMGYIPHTHQILITDMVFGQIFELDDEFHHKLKITGMLHVVAASGFNISLMTIISNVFSRHFGRFKSFLIWLVVAGGYVLMTDLSISIIRAFLMMFIKKAGNGLGLRNYHNLYALATASFILLLFNFQIIEKISFQLSVMATLGIITFMPLIGIDNPAIESTSASSIGKLVKEGFSTTVAAQLLTTPIILYHFSELSLISLVSNVLLLWLTPIITYGGILIYLLAVVSTLLPIVPILSFIALYLWLLAEIFIKSIGLLSKLDFLFFQDINFTRVHFILYLVIICLMYYKLRRKYEKNKKAAASLYSLKSDLDISHHT